MKFKFYKDKKNLPEVLIHMAKTYYIPFNKVSTEVEYYLIEGSIETFVSIKKVKIISKYNYEVYDESHSLQYTRYVDKGDIKYNETGLVAFNKYYNKTWWLIKV